jgi:Putative Ig domain
MAGDPYTTALTAAGGSGGYTWALGGLSTLPAGLILDSGTGVISGIPLPTAQGTATVSVLVTDGSGASAARTFSLSINQGLQISDQILTEAPDRIRLHATGGAGAPYHWETAGGSMLPAGAELDPATGTISIEQSSNTGSARIRIRVADEATPPHIADTTVVLQVLPAGVRRRRRRLAAALGTLTLSARGSLTFRAVAAVFRLFGHTTFWLALVAFWIPAAGTVPILIYSITTPGQPWKYLAVGLLTAIAALVAGCLIGFMFGIPKVAAGNAQQPAAGYLPNTNLPEVSDWLTKLLLGAGLVQLTHLGPPVGRLIDHISLGMYATSQFADSAKVMAGAILFGYTGIGLLSGYVLTSVWYLKRLNNRQT